nr:reverse transcriptase domain-containing protein [Tanacetum cinerariifolium]
MVLIPSLIVQPPLATLRTYMLWEPIKGANQGQNQPPAYQAPVYQASVDQPYIPQPQVVTTNEFTNFMKANDAILKNMQTNMTSLTNSNLELKNMFGQFMKMNTASSFGSGTLPGNTITNPKEDLKGITTRSGTAYQGPTIPTTTSSPLVVERETEVTKDTVHPTNNGSTEDVQPLVVLTESLILNSEPVISPIIEPVASPVSAPKPNQRPSIPYPSRLQDQKLRDKANDQREKFFQIFNTSINLMPFSVRNKLSLPDLSPTYMTLELADRSISRPIGVAKDVFVKVGTFHFLADFVVVDFDVDPRVSLILGRSFLKTGRALIDVFEGELTLRVDTEGDILLLEAFLNDDPSLPPPNQGNYLPQVCKELKIYEAKSNKSSIKEPPEICMEEKTALITVLKSHKQDIAGKLSDIKGIDPEFYTHKILMEEDFEPAVQHQRRVNHKIHDVIKQEVIKLLNARLIYPISDSPRVSPVHCVPKKGGSTVVENEDNELILTRLVMGWRVCID